MSNNTIWDRLIFKRFQKIFGSRLRCIVCGGAPCTKELMNFARTAFGVKFMIGYGMTEVAGGFCLTYPDDYENDNVGVPVCIAKVRLMDVPDLGLTVKSDKRGEICVKSVQNTPGYFEQPDKTAELIDSDGWLHTGDIGEWSDCGYLKLVDRCKNIFKLSQGEYLAPQKIEDVYLANPLITQIYVDGLSEYSYAIALVYLEFSEVINWLSHKQLSSSIPKNVKELSGNTEIKKLILEELAIFGKKHKLNGFEIVKNILILEEPFSTENSLMTPTLKVARHKVKKLYLPQIRKLYEQ